MYNRKRVVCCIPVCKGEYLDLAHKFPRDKERAIQWLAAINNSKLNEISLSKLSAVYQVCARHFRDKDYKHAQSRNLNKTAVPSLNLKDLTELHLCRDSMMGSYRPRGQRSTHRLVSSDDQLVFSHLDEDPGQISKHNQASPNEEPQECVENHFIPGQRESPSNDPSAAEQMTSTWHPRYFELYHPLKKVKQNINYLWLRCHCRCNTCVDVLTGRRIVSPTKIPPLIKPSSIENASDTNALIIRWDDGHQSEYSADFLYSANQNSAPIAAILWQSGDTVFTEFPPEQCVEFISDNTNLKSVFDALQKCGVAVVEDIPGCSKNIAEAVMSLLFPHLQRVEFEDMEEVHEEISTNMTYSNVDSALKCFFFTKETCLSLVDGFNITQELMGSDPDAFEVLSTVSVPFELGGRNVLLKVSVPTIDIDPQTHGIRQIRLDAQRIGTFDSKRQKVFLNFLTALRKMIELIQNEENQWTLNVKPGTLVIIDNNRVLHRCYGNNGCFLFLVSAKDYNSRIEKLDIGN